MKTNITDQEITGYLKSTSLKKKEAEAVKQYLLTEDTLMEVAGVYNMDSDNLLDLVVSAYQAVRRAMNPVEIDLDTFLSVSDALNLQYKTQRILQMILVDGYTSMQVYRLFGVPKKRMEAKIKLIKKILSNHREVEMTASHAS